MSPHTLIQFVEWHYKRQKKKKNKSDITKINQFSQGPQNSFFLNITLFVCLQTMKNVYKILFDYTSRALIVLFVKNKGLLYK